MSEQQEKQELPAIKISELAHSPEVYSALLAYECYRTPGFTETLKKGDGAALQNALSSMYQRAGLKPPPNLDVVSKKRVVVHENDDKTWHVILPPRKA